MKCGDKVIDVRNSGHRVIRIFVGEYDGRFLLVHSGEEDIFYSDLGGAITYWSDEVHEIPIINVGLTEQNLCTIKNAVNRCTIAEEQYFDQDGNPVVLRFMSKEMSV